jgi:hypothetical protein
MLYIKNEFAIFEKVFDLIFFVITSILFLVTGLSKVFMEEASRTF